MTARGEQLYWGMSKDGSGTRLSILAQPDGGVLVGILREPTGNEPNGPGRIVVEMVDLTAAQRANLRRALGDG